MIDKSIKKVMVIGSGPIIIGQAAEFDYAGTQACRSLKEEGIEVVLVNSNPATIMTDGDIADIVVDNFDLRPHAIIKTLGLRAPIYLQTAAYGHFGKPGLPWERCDRVEELKKYLPVK